MNKPVQHVTIETLGKLQGGVVGNAINAALRRAVHDCDDRPSLKKPRSVLIQVSFEPRPDDRSRTVPHVAIGVVVKDKLPDQNIPSEVVHLTRNEEGYAIPVLPEYSAAPLFDDIRSDSQEA